MVTTYIRGLITPVITTHEPPSKPPNAMDPEPFSEALGLSTLEPHNNPPLGFPDPREDQGLRYYKGSI